MSAGQRSLAHIQADIEGLENVDLIKLLSFLSLVSRPEKMKTWQILYLDMTVHLHPGRRCQGLESPASHTSSCRGAGFREMDMSSLKFWFSSTNLLLLRTLPPQRAKDQTWGIFACYILLL